MSQHENNNSGMNEEVMNAFFNMMKNITGVKAMVLPAGEMPEELQQVMNQFGAENQTCNCDENMGLMERIHHLSNIAHNIGEIDCLIESLQETRSNFIEEHDEHMRAIQKELES